MSTEKVFALNATYIDQYNDVVSGNTNNNNLRVFSIDDNVLDLIEEKGQKGEVTLICTESGMSNKNASLTFSVPNSSNVLTGKIKFERYGIYYTLYSRVDGSQANAGILYLDLEPVYYHQRCGNTVGPYNTYDYTNNNLINALKYQSYQGSKNLNKLYIRSRYKIKVAVSTGTITYLTDWIQVRVNY